MSYRPLISNRENNGLVTFVAVGALGVAGGLLFDSARLWPSFVLNSFFFLTLALGAMVLSRSITSRTPDGAPASSL